MKIETIILNCVGVIHMMHSQSVLFPDALVVQIIDSTIHWIKHYQQLLELIFGNTLPKGQ